MVKCDIYFDKDAIVEVGDVVFKGESKEPTAEASFSNQMVSNYNAMSAPKNTENLEPDAPKIITKTASKPPDVPNPPEISKTRRNSLTGFPQYDPVMMLTVRCVRNNTHTMTKVRSQRV